MVQRKALPNVAVAYPVGVPWVGLFLRGIEEYAEQRGGWNITTCPPTIPGSDQAALNVYTLRGWPGDGAIVSISSPAEARAVRKLRIPTVNLTGNLLKSPVPRVMVDHYAIGRLAAEHLLERGLRRVAYCGTPGLAYSQQRGLGFAHRAKEAGVSCDIFELLWPKNVRVSWHKQLAPLDRWLKRLQPPVGVLAVHDHIARIIVDECLRLGVDVPNDMAIIGNGNDTTVCEFCQPTISSVSRSAWLVGYATAELLDRLMAGGDPPSDDILIPPDGVVARQSTDTVVVDDPQVAAAIRFMSNNASESFGMNQVLHSVSISRRRLEIRFRQALGCSPYEYLCRCRVESAKRQLRRTELVKLQKIAKVCGFTDVRHLRRIFRQLTNMNPSEYRNQCHLHRL
jgi:LacI family transcriptional regulator